MTNHSLLTQEVLQGESQQVEFIEIYYHLEQRSIVNITVNIVEKQNYNWGCLWAESDIKFPNIKDLTMTSQT